MRLAEGRRVRGRCVVLASGAAYRRPNIANLARFEGHGPSYWGPPIEAKLVKGQQVVLVGGGNSAGRAAVFLASHAERMRMLVRGEGLATTMSRNLVDRIAASPGVELHTGTEVVRLQGDRIGLTGVTWRHRASGEEHERVCRNLFVFAGADPNTGWLGGCWVDLDRYGFVRTGHDIEDAALKQASWHEARKPLALETSIAGVFAIGDVRSGSIKRVAAAVGAAAAVVAQLHVYLAAQAASGRESAMPR